MISWVVTTSSKNHVYVVENTGEAARASTNEYGFETKTMTERSQNCLMGFGGNYAHNTYRVRLGGGGGPLH